MKLFTINTKSWHYWFATVMGDFSRYDITSDICTYTRSIFLGMLLTFLLSFLVFIGFILPVGNLIYCLFIWKINSLAIGAIAFLVTIMLMALLFKLSSIYYKYKSHHSVIEENKPDNFIKQAYASWKNKFCIKVEFK